MKKKDRFTDLDYQYKKLLRSIRTLSSQKNIISSLKLARKAHSGQKRDEGQDFFIHPVRIANCLINELSTKNPDLIIAGILHDVVEDSETTINDIQNKFGKRVSTIVEIITRDPKKETKIEKHKRLMKKSAEIKLVKAVDRLDNMRSMPYRVDRGARFKRHLKEIFEMNLPLAKSVNPYILREMKKVIKRLETLGISMPQET
ncbi:bifunctional (p)ppGpp synthetase/guanosine-3',5'-bis(diphosphate) 3'-pyrophosphohydrolase [Candidatus Dojkabacteria bacterium]|nr:bifunctional (p)ppGpp synthetase/guanosine-3',5'-bis(diphosphate) 3'-pyrophosphohydrolase [Candidatus Dojkabacteria bacterium]